MVTILDTLRQACHEQHEALHAHEWLRPLNGGHITLARYRGIIAMFHAAYRETEANKPSSDLPDAPVMQWLEADMARHTIPALEWHAPALAIAQPAQLLGYLYVKQGSTLGGQVISKHLHETLGFAPGSDNRFFGGYGRDTGLEWKKFKEMLISKSEHLQQDVIVASARAAFDSIRFCADRMLGISL